MELLGWRAWALEKIWRRLIHFQRACACVLSTSRCGLTLYYNCPMSDVRGGRGHCAAGEELGTSQHFCCSAMVSISLLLFYSNALFFPLMLEKAGEHVCKKAEKRASPEISYLIFFFSKTNPIHNRKETGRRRWKEPKCLLAAHVSSLSTNQEI